MLTMASTKTFGRWFAVGTDPLDIVLRPGNLSVLFQPIVDLRPRGRLLHSLECLARGPVGTPLEDAEALFDYVRRRGEEIRVDRACAANAIASCAEVAAASRFAINVHAKTLAEDEKFGDFLVGMLQRVSLKPTQIILDVLAPRDFNERLYDGLERLRALGVQLAIDDIGLSSTDYEGLVECRPDYLKLDRGLVKRNGPDDLRQIMMDSIVRLARGMGAQVIAEGVETLDELDGATQNGVNLVQGHFFGEAMTPAALNQTGLLQAS